MENRKVSLSVCMLVKDEENNLPLALESVKNIADEIIVVDNGSVDCTIKIAKKFNAKVYNGAGLELDKARQIYLDESTCDWILIIDADELFEEKDIDSLMQKLHNADERTWGIGIIENQYIGTGRWCECPLLRIIRNNGKVFYNNTPIHATMVPSILNNGAKIEDSNIQIHHFDILKNDKINVKRTRYKELLERQLKLAEENDLADVYIFLSMEYIALEKYEKAEDLLLKAIKEKKSHFAIIVLCKMYLYLGWFEKVSEYISFCENEINIVGNYLYYTERKACEEYYEEVLTKNRKKASAYINLAYLKRKDKEQARYLTRRAFDINPMLKNRIIYANGYQPNLFEFQSDILYELKNVYELYEDLGINDFIF